MTETHADVQATDASERYRALLAVSEAFVAQRDLSALFQVLVDRSVWWILPFLVPIVNFIVAILSAWISRRTSERESSLDLA